MTVEENIDFSRATAQEASSLIARGKLTAVQLVEHCLARIEQREKEVQAWAYVDAAQVLAQARVCDRTPRRSPLHGIPIGIKDIIDTADMPTEYGSPIYAGHRPASDAACVAALRQAGAIVMGKTVTVEFAQRHPAKTRNPHNPAHTPGGSSSGSAAAVADFMVPLALGTQTGGSVIRPAAYCGVVGLKPTFNVINPAGVKPVAQSLDTVGIMGRTVADVALVFSVMTGSRAPDFGAAVGDKPRIGFCRTPQWPHAEPPTVAALEEAVPRLARAGARLKEVMLPERFSRMLDAQGKINDFESTRALSYERFNFPEKISSTLMKKLEQADACTLEEYLAARKFVAECRRSLEDVFAEHDALLVPSAPGEAPYGLETTGDAIFNRIWTALHVPAVTVPVFTGPRGLPLGAQLIAPFGMDYKAMLCAEWVYRALT